MAGIRDSLPDDIILNVGKEIEMPRATLTSKGQLTIPKQLRERLRLEVGDQIDFSVDDRGRLIGIPARRGGTERLAGSLHHLAKARPVSLEQMEEVIRRHYRDEDR
jgi:AbrB family looped-hinge helix DNA binding protein